jgi:hypothetical protein
MPAFGGMWPRWRQALPAAAHRGVVCFGPDRGRRTTYADPHRWLARVRPLDGSEALAEVVRRYLHAYGPATSAHVARWLAAAPRVIGPLVDELAADGAVEPVTVEGERAWVVAGDLDVPGEPPSGVRLLPYFDAYSVGCHPRERVFPGAASERALNRGQGGNYPVLLVDGTVAGVWHQRRSGRKVAVTVEPLGSLRAAQRRALDDEVTRVGEIVEATPTLTIGPVTVGPHA